MGYEDIIAARKKLHALGVGHYDLGGAIGGGALGTAVLGPMGMIPGALAGSGGSGLMGGINALGNAAGKIVPTNNYNAQAPGITTQNFQPGMSQAMSDYTYGQGALHNSVDRQNWSGDQQAGAAGALGGDAANVSGLATGANGLGGILSQQQTLGQALAAQAAGQGPNPAQEQYKQNIDRAISQNAGMIASQKGINPALAARMAADNAASMSQGAAGNAATLQAQQQLAAESALGQNQVAQGQTIMGQGNLYSTAGGLHSAEAGAYGGAGQTFQGAANTAAQATGQANQLYGTNVAGQGAQNNTITTGSLGTQGINAGVSNQNTAVKGQMIGGLLQGAGSLATMGLSGGGTAGAVGVNGSTGQGSNSFSQGTNPNFMGPPAMARGGVAGVDGKAMSLAQALMAQGGEVPGRANVPGDSPINDVVPTVLSPGEVVIPRSQADDPEKAARFVAALKERDGAKEPEGYGHVLKKVRALRTQIAALEKTLGGGAS